MLDLLLALREWDGGPSTSVHHSTTGGNPEADDAGMEKGLPADTEDEGSETVRLGSNGPGTRGNAVVHLTRPVYHRSVTRTAEEEPDRCSKIRGPGEQVVSRPEGLLHRAGRRTWREQA